MMDDCGGSSGRRRLPGWGNVGRVGGSKRGESQGGRTEEKNRLIDQIGRIKFRLMLVSLLVRLGEKTKARDEQPEQEVGVSLPSDRRHGGKMNGRK